MVVFIKNIIQNDTPHLFFCAHKLVKSRVSRRWIHELFSIYSLSKRPNWCVDECTQFAPYDSIMSRPKDCGWAPNGYLLFAVKSGTFSINHMLHFLHFMSGGPSSVENINRTLWRGYPEEVRLFLPTFFFELFYQFLPPARKSEFG